MSEIEPVQETYVPTTEKAPKMEEDNKAPDDNFSKSVLREVSKIGLDSTLDSERLSVISKPAVDNMAESMKTPSPKRSKKRSYDEFIE